MRRTALPGLIGLVLLLPGCTGFGEFLNHTFSPPGTHPTMPGADSETVRRVLGRKPEVDGLQPEKGNVWPGPEAPSPTLNDLERNPAGGAQRGFEPTAVPGAEPGLPAGRQPRPTTRGSSTPPGAGLGIPPAGSNTPLVNPPPEPRSSVPSAGPQGPVVQTPRGPAVDAGGTSGYRQSTTPQGPGAILIPNGNGTSTLIRPDGSVSTVPTR